MNSLSEFVVPNRASRWSSVILWLIWAFGVYGVLGTAAWPPGGLQDGLAYLSLILLPLVAVRLLRARVVLDANGLVSRNLRNKEFTWDQVSGFSVRGQLLQNEVGVDLRQPRPTWS